MCVGKYTMAHVQRSKGNLREWVFSFYPVGSKNQTWVFRPVVSAFTH